MAPFANVDEYIAAQPTDVRPLLEQVRTAILKGVPKADELISYNMPAYKLDGRWVLAFAGWKRHFSLYPASDAVRALLAASTAPHDVNEKGTARFPLDAPVPVRLIERIARARAKESP